MRFSRLNNSVLALLLSLIYTAQASDDRKLRSEFIEAMREVEEEHAHRDALNDLHRSLLEKAIYIGGDSDRNLYYRNNNNNNYYQNNNNGNQYKQSQQMQYYFNQDFDWDLSGLALKYIGCQNIETWSDNAASSGTEPLIMDKFVMFRLCPKNSCSSFNRFGCSSDYGEYMIAMEEYLLLMSQYHFSQYDRYCGVCSSCLVDDSSSSSANDDDSTSYYANEDDDASANQYAGDDDNVYQHQQNAGQYNDDRYAANSNYANGGYRRKTYGGNYYNSGNNQNYAWYLDQYGECVYKTVCKNYKTACKNYNSGASYYENYFTCSAFNVGNSVGYLGPHCRSDGQTIGIGIFEDENCNSYVGDSVDISKATGQQFDDGALRQYYDRSCISCLAKESYSLVTDSDYDTATDYTYPICNILYDVAGKCNRHFSSAPNMTSNEEQTEETVCNLVASLVENNYDERGRVIIQTEFNLTHWTHASEYAKVVTQASRGQRVSLTLFVSISVFLFAYSAYLHDKLRKRSAHFVAPFDSKYSRDGLSNKFSGIMNMRSGSSGITSFRQTSPDGSDSYFGGTFV